MNFIDFFIIIFFFTVYYLKQIWLVNRLVRHWRKRSIWLQFISCFLMYFNCWIFLCRFIQLDCSGSRHWATNWAQSEVSGLDTYCRRKSVFSVMWIRKSIWKYFFLNKKGAERNFFLFFCLNLRSSSIFAKIYSRGFCLVNVKRINPL